MSNIDDEANINEALALFESGSPREWPVCASFSEDPNNNGCFMSRNGQSEFLNRKCYNPNDAENPKHWCDACKKPLHSALCAPSHSEDRAKLMCKLCVEQTMDVDDAAAMATGTGTGTGTAVGHGRGRRKRSSTATAAAVPQKKKKQKKTVRQQYQPYLFKFMNFKNNPDEEYTKETVFSNEQLFDIKPDDLARWFKLQAYGDTEANIETELPTKCRLSNLEFIKKSISHFMPDKNTPWSVRHNSGNPTRSNQIQEILKKVKRAEIRGQGRESMARGPFVEPEYEQCVGMMEAHEDIELRLFTSAIFRTQYNMGGRIDDVSKHQTKNIVPNQDLQHDNLSISTKLPWSKNVSEHRQAPWQILIGAAHPCYCVLLGLATWLEWMIMNGRDSSEFVYAYKGTDDEDTIRRSASDGMRKVLHDPSFIIVLEDKKGTHSMRKFGTDQAKKRGIHKDDIDHRFRWGTKRQQDRYASTTIPSCDGIVAAALCKDGPIHYHIKEFSGIDDAWVCDNVTPNIARKYGLKVAAVLGRALLWRIFDPEQSGVVPPIISTRVKDLYKLVRDSNLEDGENPIAKVPLDVRGDINGNLILTVLNDSIDDDAISENENEEERVNRLRHKYNSNINNRRVNNRRTENQQIDRLSALISTLQQGLQETENRQNRRYDIQNRKIDQLTALIRQLLRQPYRVLGSSNRNNHDNRNNLRAAADSAAEEDDATNRSIGTLKKNPKCLHTLWMEYEFGLGGKKAAKMFTASERGRCKYSYCNRLVFWKKISEMVRAGWNSTAAIEKVTTQYGSNLSVTKVLSQMRKDKTSENGYPRVFDLPS